MDSGIEILKTSILYQFRQWQENRVIAESSFFRNKEDCLAFLTYIRKNIKRMPFSCREIYHSWKYEWSNSKGYIISVAMSKEDVEKNIVLIKRFMPTKHLIDSTGELKIEQSIICADCKNKVDTANDVENNYIMCNVCKTDWANKDTMKLNFETLRRFDCPLKEIE